MVCALIGISLRYFSDPPPQLSGCLATAALISASKIISNVVLSYKINIQVLKPETKMYINEV